MHTAIYYFSGAGGPGNRGGARLISMRSDPEQAAPRGGADRLCLPRL